MTYIFVIAANENDWCYFDAAVMPGHEEELKAAILADIAYPQAYDIDTFEAYTVDDDGTLTCADTRATYYCDDPESIAKALPLDGKPFAFLAGDSGLHG